MPIRDVVFAILWLGLLPVSLLRPWLGILAWYWLAYFVPHAHVWGFARSIPVAAGVGGATLVGFLFAHDRKPLPRSSVTFFMLAFVADYTLTTILAHNPQLSFEKWTWVSKVLLMTFVTMSLFQDRARLRWLYMVPALGIGFYGFKGGIWVLVTGGGELVFGPDMSFFADNNTLGLALCMVLPILLYLSRDEKRPWLKRILQVTFCLSIISIIFTYSRGAFLGLFVILSVLIWRSPWRMRFATAIILAALIAAPLAPQRIWDRLGSIGQQESADTRDTSAAARLEAWRTSWELALDRPFTGGGFRALWNEDLWLRYYGQGFQNNFDAHSIYFEVLGEHGFLGFALYFGALVTALLTLRRLRKRWRDDPEHKYISHYAEMLQLSLYPFLVSGAFVGVAYFDIYFLILGTVAVLQQLSWVAETATAPAPAVKQGSRLPTRGRTNTLPSGPRRRPRHA
jgi:probable O-glycosylation ligase (exosortase A-associated)